MLVIVLICCNTIPIAIAGDTNYSQKEAIRELKAINLTKIKDDYVKSVKGTLILEKDVLGLINPNYDKKQVNVVYSPAQYSLAVDQVAFDFCESNLSQNIIFRWTNFTIQGVTGGYSVAGDNIQGKVEDFC